MMPLHYVRWCPVPNRAAHHSMQQRLVEGEGYVHLLLTPASHWDPATSPDMVRFSCFENLLCQVEPFQTPGPLWSSPDARLVLWEDLNN